MKRPWIRWAVSGLVALTFVLYIPELALAMMIVPFGGITSDPYVSIMLMFGASLIAMFVLMNAAEVAVIMCAMALSSTIVKWQRWVRIRNAIMEMS